MFLLALLLLLLNLDVKSCLLVLAGTFLLLSVLKSVFDYALSVMSQEVAAVSLPSFQGFYHYFYQ